MHDSKTAIVCGHICISVTVCLYYFITNCVSVCLCAVRACDSINIRCMFLSHCIMLYNGNTNFANNHEDLLFLIQRFYIPSSRQLKRIESVTHSPIFNHFNETITGTVSIRAYKAQDRFVKEIMEKMDKHLVFYFAGIASNRYFNCLE